MSHYFKVICFFLLFFMLLNVKVNAQEIEWLEKFGGLSIDEASSIQQSIDGGYIIAGSSFSDENDVVDNYGKSDYWILKLEESANILWQRNYGGSKDDKAYSIQQTNDGGYIVAGVSKSNDYDVVSNYGNYGFYDCWILKLDEVGEIEWQKNYGGSKIDVANAVRQTKDGGYIVAGYTESIDFDLDGSLSGLDYWIFKLDSIGSVEWQKKYGGVSSDYATSIEQTKDGGFIVSGYSLSDPKTVFGELWSDSKRSFNTDISGNFGNSDCWILKLDEIGNIDWERNYGGSLIDQALAIQQTVDGGYIIACNSFSLDFNVGGNYGKSDYWILKIDSIGAIDWGENYGGTEDDFVRSIYQTFDGGYIIAGFSSSDDINVGGNEGGQDYWILKINSKGSIEWEKNYGSSEDDVARSIIQSKDGGFVIAGFYKNPDDSVLVDLGSRDYWIVKLK